MQRTRIVSITILLALSGICALLLLFVDGTYLPNKPCRPITFPDGKRTNRAGTQVAEVPIQTVLSFYDAKLNAQTGSVDFREWSKELRKDGDYLYSCYAVDINLLTTETGCIWVSGSQESTQIKVAVLRGEGGSWSCLRDID